MFIRNARYQANITILPSSECKNNLQLKSICHFALPKSLAPFIPEEFQLSFASFWFSKQLICFGSQEYVNEHFCVSQEPRGHAGAQKRSSPPNENKHAPFVCLW